MIDRELTIKRYQNVIRAALSLVQLEYDRARLLEDLAKNLTAMEIGSTTVADPIALSEALLSPDGWDVKYDNQNQRPTDEAFFWRLLLSSGDAELTLRHVFSKKLEKNGFQMQALLNELSPVANIKDIVNPQRRLSEIKRHWERREAESADTPYEHSLDLESVLPLS